MKEIPPSKILQGRCSEPGASYHGRNKFPVDFSVTFPRFPRVSKTRLNSLLTRPNVIFPLLQFIFEIFQIPPCWSMFLEQ